MPPEQDAGPLSASASVVVARPAADLWALVADVALMPRWSPSVLACWWDEGEGPSAAVPGAWFSGRNTDGATTWDTRSLVVASEPGREVAWQVRGSWVRWGWSFAPLEGDPGGTRVTESWAFLPDGLAGFAARWGEAAPARVALRAGQARASLAPTLEAFRRSVEAG